LLTPITHVVHELTHGSAHGIRLAGLIGRRKLHDASIQHNIDQRITGQLQGTAAPLTLIWSSLIDTSTPAGMVTGIFPTRDISVSPQCRDQAT
jgi:hypothetical protein